MREIANFENENEPSKTPGCSRRAFLGASMTAAAGAASLRASSAKASTVEASLSCNLRDRGVSFDRMLFGQFLEHFHRQVYGGIFEPGSHLSDEYGMRADVIEALRELKIPIVRWPGGCFVSSYHWLHGTGRNRQPVFDKAWGVEDPNTFGTDEFVTWCRKIGAEPYICTNAGNGTPEEMSDWVEYCNLRKQGRFARMRQYNGFNEPHNVRYWSIGNENYGTWEIGAKTIAEWGPLVRESAKMMRAVDPGIKLFAAAKPRPEWTLPLLREAGEWLDFISNHGYWDPLHGKNNPAGYLKCMMLSTRPEEVIARTIRMLKDSGFAEKIKIAFDEWNLRGWHHPGFPGGGTSEDLIRQRDKNDLNETYTMTDALFSACFLNTCLRNAEQVRMACMAPVVNTRGPLYVHPDGIVKRTAFHVLKMYSDLLQPVVLPVKCTSAPLEYDGEPFPSIDAVVTSSEDRRSLAIILVNRHPDKRADITLTIPGLSSGTKCRTTILAGDSADAYNDIRNPRRVEPEVHEQTVNSRIGLPPHSVSIIQSMPA